MRLRIPDVSKAIETVNRVKSELGNAQSGGNSAAGKAADFLTWCESWARPQLGNYFPDIEPLFDELAESHRRIVLRPEMDEQRLYGLLGEEFKAWDARLSRLLSALEVLKPFLQRPGRLLVLDTSALMEGKPFRDFQWTTLIPPTPPPGVPGPHVRLIVPILVIEELDELMHDRDGDRRKRARDTFKALWEVHRDAPTEARPLPEQPAVTIEVMLDDDWHQRRPNNDAEIVDQAVIVHELTGRDVRLVTADGPLLYRAAAAGLMPVRMPRRDEV